MWREGVKCTDATETQRRLGLAQSASPHHSIAITAIVAIIACPVVLPPLATAKPSSTAPPFPRSFLPPHLLIRFLEAPTDTTRLATHRPSSPRCRSIPPTAGNTHSHPSRRAAQVSRRCSRSPHPSECANSLLFTLTSHALHLRTPPPSFRFAPPSFLTLPSRALPPCPPLLSYATRNPYRILRILATFACG